MERIGIFICHCGTNIGAVVDAALVADELKSEPAVEYTGEYTYLCSDAGQNMIINAITEHNLTGLVISACSPRMHEATFRKIAEKVGLNPYMVEIANIREQCSWVHDEKIKATEKAITLTRIAAAKVKNNTPLIPSKVPVIKRALVIGGGIAGIQAALDIAEAGFKVDIVESTPSIGGKMAMLDKTFPTLDCSACILTPKMVDAANHENIILHTYSEVEKIEGYIGNFTVTIKKKARSVDINKCTGCGDCSAKCPVNKIPSEFDAYTGYRTAIYVPFAQAVPNIPVIDRNRCLKFKNNKCGLCKTICQPGAIDFTQDDEYLTQQYGAVIAATGFKPIDLEKFGEYSYKDSKDVITSLEFERMTNAAGPSKGEIVRLSDGRKPKSIVFIQCVGSRDITERGKPYCSKICCMYTAKHATMIKNKHPEINVSIYYIDVRTPGKNFDEFYRRAAEEYGVKYIKGQVGKIIDKGDSLWLQTVDMLDNKRSETTADLVVLATAIEPVESAKNIALNLSAGTDADNFFTESHPKLRPVESPTAGVFLCGVCQGPKDIPETVAQAGAAASKTIGLLSKNDLLNDPCTASVDIAFCNGCLLCEPVCPYNAILYDESEHKSNVNQSLCRGCGACVVACPSGTMDLNGFSNIQLTAEVDALCR